MYGAISAAEEAHQNRTNRTIGQSTADGSILPESGGHLPGTAITGEPTKSIAEAEGRRTANGNVDDQQRTLLVISAAAVAVSSRGCRQCCNRSTDAILHDGCPAPGDSDATQSRCQTGPSKFRNGSCGGCRDRSRFVLGIGTISGAGHLPGESSPRNSDGKHCPRSTSSSSSSGADAIPSS